MNRQREAILFLLNNTKRIVKHQEEIKILRGENFNIFSVLKMESKENATHSALIGELLNPKGSHLIKSLFLSHSLKTIDYKGSFDITSANLVLEKHIGGRDDNTKHGGRIDIYLYDAKGNTISIENKIYAMDQKAQIERYVNHNTDKNKVYYLTLHGDDASEHSKGHLKNNKDYSCISYKRTIINWLELCLKEAVEQPILRESIKQYILLLKKMTSQLSDQKMDEEIQDLIVKNYYSAKFIEANVWKAEQNATYSLLIDIKTEIQKVLKEDWTITVDENLSVAWTGLKITHTSWNGILVKLEGDSKVPWTKSYYGIAAPDKEFDRGAIRTKIAKINILDDTFSSSWAWPYYKTIMSLQSNDDRMKLFNSSERALLIKDVSDKLIELAKACEIPLADIPRISISL